jgi:hypothetical protein
VTDPEDAMTTNDASVRDGKPMNDKLFPPTDGRSPRRRLGASGVSLGVALLGALGASTGLFAPTVASAQEPAACLSANPALWPKSAKPYFMIALDTSGSMISQVTSTNTCGFQNGVYGGSGMNSTRMGHAKCAIRNTVQAFSGQVNFGLAQFASSMTGCGASCYGSNGVNPFCQIQCYDAEVDQFGSCAGCGPMDNAADPATARGGRVLVPMMLDTQPTPPASNVNGILQWVDNNCTSNLEVTNVPHNGPAYGLTPLNGLLRDMRRYYASGWTNPDNAAETYPSPLSASDPACRSVNVILITDGDETCDSQADANAAVQALFNQGATFGGKTWNIRTHVINFAGGNQANTDQLADLGNDGVDDNDTASYFATNETQLASALASIVASTIAPEVCDNVDNNCNGCTDEGFNHYCNIKPAGQCCSWGTAAQRTTCLTNYQASITALNPSGNLALLPCTTAAQSTTPAQWLCFNPGELCDNQDNNCVSGVDEGVLKCGSPAACPSTEICDGKDNDCDGQTDENVCGGCVPSAEVCDGCDNDCDGLIDEGIATIPCGLPSPANCAGTLTCTQAAGTYPAGSCVGGGGFTQCSNNPQTETCDGIDNDCDGIADDNVAPVACVPSGTPGGLVYGGNSQCQMGTQPCNGQCTGFIGPSAEVCDGIDNDCDGQVDEGVLGVGQPCGVNQPPCTPGTTACVNGALVCQGGVGPQPEVCDGLDNDCDANVDEAPLADAPPAGQNGCWDEPVGGCNPVCVFDSLQWCPPTTDNGLVGSCFDNGTLAPPCNKGTLQCSGAAGWACVGPKGPEAEACDGIDNDCDGTTDEAADIPQIGLPCGSDVGECSQGALACVNNVLDCVGDTPGVPEVCDGLDNDCDGVVDNGIVVGGACTPAYDTTLYPGDRSFPPCLPGILQCDGNGGSVCVGGVGPSPEVCDGIDNDCDGVIDEPGAAPDGLNGSQNPFPPPDAAIGDACGVDTGACTAGNWACDNGLFICLGGQSAVDEQCDCQDNDCDGTVDNQTPGGVPICGGGKDCVATAGGSCQCAAPCQPGETPCPTGQKCEQVTSSETGQIIGNFCVTDFEALCGDCAAKTINDTNGNVECAPAGTELPGCVTPPVCECKGASGCHAPCFGQTCQNGLVCAQSGPSKGQCVQDNCYNVPCQGCDSACHAGGCTDDPCEPNPCMADEVCKPTADFTSHTCVGSCAEVTCDAGQACVDGQCVPGCDPACGDGQVCDLTATPPACVADQCTPNPCTDGSCCDPVTGQCGDCPCEGVVCPEGQECSSGQCVPGSSTGGGGQGGQGGGGNAGGQGGSGNQGNSGTGGQGGAPQKGVFGLATGGGGLFCSVSSVGGRALDASAAAGVLLAAAGFLARRRRKDERA